MEVHENPHDEHQNYSERLTVIKTNRNPMALLCILSPCELLQYNKEVKTVKMEKKLINLILLINKIVI